MAQKSVNIHEFILSNRSFCYQLYLYTVIKGELKETDDGHIFVVDKKYINFSKLAREWGQTSEGRWIVGDNETIGRAFKKMVEAGIYTQLEDGNYQMPAHTGKFQGCKFPVQTLQWIHDNCSDDMARVLCYLLNNIHFYTVAAKEPSKSYNFYISSLFKILGFKSMMTRKQRTSLEGMIEYFSSLGFFDYYKEEVVQHNNKTYLFHCYNINFVPEAIESEYSEEIFGSIDDEKYFDKEIKVLLELPDPNNFISRAEYEKAIIDICAKFLIEHNTIPVKDYNVIKTQVKNIAYKHYLKDWIVKVEPDKIILERYI